MIRTKNVARLASTSRRVAPRKPGNESCVAPIRAMVMNRLNRMAQPCHGRSGQIGRFFEIVPLGYDNQPAMSLGVNGPNTEDHVVFRDRQGYGYWASRRLGKHRFYKLPVWRGRFPPQHVIMRDTPAGRRIPREIGIVLRSFVFDGQLLWFARSKCQGGQRRSVQSRYSCHVIEVHKLEQIALYRLARSGGRPQYVLVLVVVVLAPLAEPDCCKAFAGKRTVITTAKVAVRAINQKC